LWSIQPMPSVQPEFSTSSHLICTACLLFASTVPKSIGGSGGLALTSRKPTRSPVMSLLLCSEIKCFVSFGGITSGSLHLSAGLSRLPSLVYLTVIRLAPAFNTSSASGSTVHPNTLVCWLPQSLNRRAFASCGSAVWNSLR